MPIGRATGADRRHHPRARARNGHGSTPITIRNVGVTFLHARIAQMQAHCFLRPPHRPRLLTCSPPYSAGVITKHAVASLRCALKDDSTASSIPLSISDDELAARGLRIRRSAAGLDLEALNVVFTRVGFPRREEAKIRSALEHTDALVWLEKDGGDGVRGVPVAFARATGDGVFNAVVWDVVVEPEVQGTGLGRAVMERLVGDLRRRGIVNIALYAEPKVVGFYRPLGFAADPDGVKAMVYSRRKKKR